MKQHVIHAMTKLCSLCLVLSGLFYWKGVSVILFGEKEYPKESDFEA